MDEEQLPVPLLPSKDFQIRLWRLCQQRLHCLPST